MKKLTPYGLNEKITILLVDDSPENIFTLESILEKPTRIFLQANSGDVALKLEKSNRLV